MSRATWVQLFTAATEDGVSASFPHNGSQQGVYVIGVLGGASLILEARVPREASNISAPETFVPVVNGEWRQVDMYPTEYSAGGNPAYGMMKTLGSVPAEYRMRLTGADADTVVWAYMTRS